MKHLTEKIIFSLITLTIIGWCTFHIFNNFDEKIELETAFEYTLTHSVNTTGFVVRDEIIMDESSSEGVRYLFGDAQRVSKGQTISIQYSDPNADKNYTKMQELSEEISLLKKAQDTGLNNYSNIDTINRDLRAAFRNLGIMTNSGVYDDIAVTKTQLTYLLNRRQIASRKEEDYINIINELEDNYKKLEDNKENNQVVASTAPVSGFFAKNTDGYEEKLNTDKLSGYKYADYMNLIEGKIKPGKSGIKTGRIVKSPKWYYVTCIDKSENQTAYVGKPVKLVFVQTDIQMPFKIKNILKDESSEKEVVIFECDIVNDEIINLREEPVLVIMDEYTGYRVPVISRRFIDDVEGVYVLDRGIIKFKTIDPVYEDQSFIISKPYLEQEENQETNGVKLYDQIITKGTDMYDGKPVF